MRQQYPRYYSFAFHRLTDSKTRIGSTAKAQLAVQKINGETANIHVQLDSGGSQNLAGREILQNVRKAEDYGRTPIYMVTVSGDTPAYRSMGVAFHRCTRQPHSNTMLRTRTSDKRAQKFRPNMQRHANRHESRYKLSCCSN